MFIIQKISADEWNYKYAHNAHLSVFGEDRASTLNRIDYALIAEDNLGVPAGFITCKEMDSETLYWQFGGAFPNYRGKVYTPRGYSQFINWAKERYKRVTTRIENGNIVMIKMAMTFGFKIIGTYNFNSKVYLELTNEFTGG